MGQRGNHCLSKRVPELRTQGKLLPSLAQGGGPGRRARGFSAGWGALEGRLPGLNTMELQSPSPYVHGLSFWPSASRALIPSHRGPQGRAVSSQCPSSRPWGVYLNPKPSLC